MDDDPLNTMFMIDRLEVGNAHGTSPLAWGARAWVGRDFNKLLLRSEGRMDGGKVEDAELEVLWVRPASRWWNLVAGARHEFEPGQSRSWLAAGVEGLAPYRLHVQATGYVGEQGRTALRLETEYELLLTNRLILQPRAELNAYGKGDPGRGIGSGVSDLEVGLRLRFEIRREVAPYVGVTWINKFGGTAGIARANGQDPHEVQVLVGLRVWY
jgi:copper resistance protein B